MSPTDGTFIHVDASMNKLLKAFSLAKVKQRRFLCNFVDTNFVRPFQSISWYFTKKKKLFWNFCKYSKLEKFNLFSLHQILKPYLKDCDNGTWFETWILIVGNMLLLFVYSLVRFNLNLAMDEFQVSCLPLPNFNVSTKLEIVMLLKPR